MHKPHQLPVTNHRIRVRPSFLVGKVGVHRWRSVCACGWESDSTADKRPAVRAASDHMVVVVSSTALRVILTIVVNDDDGD